MNVTSFAYLVFIAAVFGMALLLRLRTSHIPRFLQPYLLPLRPLNIVLLAASYGFYATFDPTFPLILLVITLAVYLCALLMAAQESSRWRRAWLALGLLATLGTLGLFKYFDFFVESFGGTSRLNLVLPVGLSFYSFQAVSYLLDVNSRHITPVKNIISFALYLAFFPRLISGPIERASALIPQIEREREITWEQIEVGSFLILQGIFKKLGVANIIGLAINPILDAPDLIGSQPSGRLWGVMLLFTLQIYLDFAGYIDIARGTGKLLGFELSQNFRAPYFAATPIEFWNRWHITLSTWLRDYLFMPTSRLLLKRTSRRALVLFGAYMLTMSISGLWHGAGWNFVVWGMLHGLALFASRLIFGPVLRPPQTTRQYLWHGLQIGMTFLLVNLLFIFFALPVGDALRFLEQMFRFSSGGLAALQTPLLYALALWLLFDLTELWVDADKLALMRLPAFTRGAVYALMAALSLASGLSYVQQFFYQQF